VGEYIRGFIAPYVGIEEIKLAAFGEGVGVRQVGRPLPQRLHLAALELEAGLELLVHGVDGAGLAVLGDDPDALPSGSASSTLRLAAGHTRVP
jgi:hypothetical protein